MPHLGLPSWVGRALIEGTLIVFAVVLGFVVNEWRENRDERRAATIALERIAEEMEDNLEILRDVVAYHEEIAASLQELRGQVDAGEAPSTGVFIERTMPSMQQGIRPPLFNDVAWDYAAERGVLDSLDYELVAEVALVYRIQDLGAGTTWRMIAQAFFFNEESFETHELSGKLTFMALAFNELASQERSLIYTYERVLPMVHEAIENS